MSNPHLEAEVQRGLSLDPVVNANAVQVRVVDGTATLRGIVASLKESEAAERATRKVAGVRQVENRLTVVANHARSDRQLNQKLDEALASLPNDEHHTVGAVAEGGIVRLVGHTRSAAEVEAARAVVAGVAGVKEIIDEVQIDAGAPMDEASVTNRVIEALSQSGLLTSSTFEVDARGGEVTLRGIVGSEAERERAEAIARAVPGVARVTNQLRIGNLIPPRRW